MTTRPSRGFTLIELLVSVAVIGVLIAVLLPTLSSVRRSAESIKATAAARSLMTAYIAYAEDNAGLVLPAHVRPEQAIELRDEFGNEIGPPVTQRWAYRLGSYFGYQWKGVTLIDSRAALIEQRDFILSQPNGFAEWAYQISVFPSFGVNRRYVGGDYRRTDWLEQRHHINRLSDAIDPANLITFSTARFVVGPLRFDGYVEVDPPPLGTEFDPNGSTAAPSLAFGRVDLRYSGNAIVGWLDGSAGPLDEAGLLDRRNWSNTARSNNDANWEP